MRPEAPDPTAAFTMGPPGAPCVLLLHGFTGSPWDLRLLGEALAARGFRVIAPRLPGHGLVPERMLWVTWRDWELAASEALHKASLDAGGRVAIAGLSMGGLLGLILAARDAQRVRCLCLMAPAVKLRRLTTRALRLVRAMPVNGLKQRWVTKNASDIEDPEQRDSAPVIPRYPLARVFDLFTLQDIAKAAAPAVRAPVLVAGAVNDHVVSLEGIRALHRSFPQSQLLVLQRGFHILPRDLDRALLFSEISEFVDQHLGRGP